jgi:hypothetical protein
VDVAVLVAALVEVLEGVADALVTALPLPPQAHSVNIRTKLHAGSNFPTSGALERIISFMSNTSIPSPTAVAESSHRMAYITRCRGSPTMNISADRSRLLY